MIKAIIIDDEWYTKEDIKTMVLGTGFIEICGTYENPIMALIEFHKTLPDLAFIDIEMPEMDGLTLAERLTEINPSLHIVFITAYNQYAVAAFELNALDYIMKPVDYSRFKKMIDKVERTIISKEQNHKNIAIRCFEDFEVKLNNAPIKWERAKAEELFAYLLTRLNRKISKFVIIDELWPEYGESNALAILQTSVCKIRNIFSELNGIVSLNYADGKYCLKITECDCDLLNLKDFFNTFNVEDEACIDYLETACKLIGQGLMSKTGYLWAYTQEAELREELSHLLNKTIEHYVKIGKADLAAKYLAFLAKIDEVDE